MELDAYMFTHAARTVAYQKPDDTFYVCDGAGECGDPGASRHLPGQQWGLGQISAPQAWSVTKGSKGVKVRPPPHVHSRVAFLPVRLHRTACSSNGRKDPGDPIRMSLLVCSSFSGASIQNFTEVSENNVTDDVIRCRAAATVSRRTTRSTLKHNVCASS